MDVSDNSDLIDIDLNLDYANSDDLGLIFSNLNSRGTGWEIVGNLFKNKKK